MNVKLTVLDYEPDTASFLHAVLGGLAAPQKTLPTSFLYDERGSRLFDQICELPEYYPTRTERAIMSTFASEITDAIGPKVALIEYGSGSSIKTRDLLSTLDEPVAYVPVDIARSHLQRSSKLLSELYPGLEVLPVCADFTVPFEVPEPSSTPTRRVLYFPGSTIGNFRPREAARLLRQMRDEVGPQGLILIGVDLVKSVDVLERAYNDSRGVTAAFNLNLLARINAELRADFDLDAFEHDAVWVAERSAIEMRLVSRRRQSVVLERQRFHFAPGEWIHTEDSHKYTLSTFEGLARTAGLSVRRVWVDDARRFSVQLLSVTE